MKKMYVLALEASTSSAKAVLFENGQGIIRVVSEPYAEGTCNVVTQDADAMVKAVLHSGKEALRGFEGKVEAIGLSGIWHSLLLLDKNRRPLSPMTTWANVDASETVEEHQRNAQEVKYHYEKTGCMIHTMYPLWQYTHLVRQRDLRLSNTAFLSSQTEYLFEAMTGRIAYSKCAAAGSGMMNIHTLSWDKDILARHGLKEEMLSPLVEPLYQAPLAPSAAMLLGLPAGTPVVIGGADGALNQVGSGGMMPGIMTFSVGTSGALRMMVPRPALPPNPSTWCYYIAEGKWIAGAATSGAGNCVDWFVKGLLGGKYTYAELETAMVQADKANAPIFLPFNYGERCPGWHSSRTGGFADIKGHQDVGALYYALQEGIIMNLYQCFLTLKAIGGTPKEIRISGGIERSRPWLQLAADLFGQPLYTSNVEHASVLGAVALALRSCGGIEKLEDFASPTGSVMMPNPDMSEHYARRYFKYSKEYQKGE